MCDSLKIMRKIKSLVCNNNVLSYAMFPYLVDNDMNLITIG